MQTIPLVPIRAAGTILVLSDLLTQPLEQACTRELAFSTKLLDMTLAHVHTPKIHIHPRRVDEGRLIPLGPTCIATKHEGVSHVTTDELAETQGSAIELRMRDVRTGEVASMHVRPREVIPREVRVGEVHISHVFATPDITFGDDHTGEVHGIELDIPQVQSDELHATTLRITLAPEVMQLERLHEGCIRHTITRRTVALAVHRHTSVSQVTRHVTVRVHVEHVIFVKSHESSCRAVSAGCRPTPWIHYTRLLGGLHMVVEHFTFDREL